MIEPDIAKITDELRQIAELIGPGSAWNILLPDDDSPVPVRLTAMQVYHLIPAPHRLGTPEQMLRQPAVEIHISRLFDQIEQGRVVARIGDLTASLPLTMIGVLPPEIREHWVEIPLNLVKTVLWRDAGIPLSRWLPTG